MAPIDSIKSAAGLYKPDRFVPIIAAIVNLLLSVLLVKPLGLVGVFIGTLVSTILFSFWIKPVLVYKYIFKRNVFEYFIDILLKLVAISIATGVCFEIGESLFREYTILNFIGRLGVCIIMPNILIIIFSFKTKEFKYILNIVKPILNKVKYGILNKLHPQIE